MKKASITEAKNNLSALIDRVKGGTSVLIVDRGRPVARLEPVGGHFAGDEAGRLERLVRAGIVRPARTVLPKTRAASEPPTRQRDPPCRLCSTRGGAGDEILGRVRDRPAPHKRRGDSTTAEGRGCRRRHAGVVGSEVECASAIARLERDGALDEASAADAFDRLRELAAGWHEVEPGDTVREAAVRFLRVHPLRAADALQLASAFVAAERRPPSLELVTLDERLGAAARKEGFRLR